MLTEGAVRAGRGRLRLLLQSSRPDQSFCTSPRVKRLLTPAPVCISSPAAGWRVPGLHRAAWRLSCPLHTTCRQQRGCFHLPESRVQTCTSVPALPRAGLGLVSSQRHHCAPSVLQKCRYRGLTFINRREEEIMLAKYCQILQIND